MKILLFFAHPSKYHAFKHTINALIRNGHKVELLIIKKDILEDLVQTEDWNYKNIFPNGRKIRGIPVYLGASINFIRTIAILLKYVWNKKYDLFFTDDLLTIVGRLKNVPTIHFQDDDLSAVPESSIILGTASVVLSPKSTNLGRFNKKKIPIYTYKELGSLHPRYFSPDYRIIKEINREENKYFLIRLVSHKSTHDVNKKGISNDKLKILIDILEKKGKIFISSEREIPKEYDKYRLKIEPRDIAHVLFYAQLFISDSQTMTSEAAMLGVPSIRYNDFVGKLSVMEEKEKEYELTFGFRSNEFERLILKLNELLEMSNLKEEFQERRQKMLSRCIDLNTFLIWFLENFPKSAEILKENPDYQLKFR